MKTKSSVRYHFLNICIICNAASINQALHPNRSHWTRLSLWSVQWLLLQCAAALQRCMEQTLWSRLCCWAQWHWYFTHFMLFYFPNIIGLVQRIVRFVMCTEPKASYRTVQYEYVYRYTPNVELYLEDSKFVLIYKLHIDYSKIYSSFICVVLSLFCWNVRGVLTFVRYCKYTSTKMIYV